MPHVLDDCRNQLAVISDEEGTEARLTDARDALRTDLSETARALSDKRTRAAKNLDARMEEALAELGLVGARFQTLITHQDDPRASSRSAGERSPFAPMA